MNVSEPTDYWIWTIQMARWRLPRELGIPLMDITAKSGIQAFAPTWENLNAYKRGEMSEFEYSRRYFDKVIPTLSTHPQEWAKLEHSKNLTLACYCQAGRYCHRHLFAVLATTYLQSKGHRVLFMGEMVEHPNHTRFMVRQPHDSPYHSHDG